MRMRLATLSILFVTAIACRKEEPKPITEQAFFEQQAASFCEFARTCFPNESIDVCTRPADERISMSHAAVQAGRMTFDAAQAELCLDALAAMTCDSYLAEFLGGNDMPAACDGVFNPAVAPNGSCFFDLECIGGFCSGRHDERCNLTGSCKAFVTAGGSCSDESPCAPGLICSSSHVCVAEPSTEGADCVEQRCAAPLYCNRTTHKCEKLTYGVVGEGCSSAAPCDLRVAICDSATVTCRAFLAENDTCTGRAECGVTTLTCAGLTFDPVTSEAVTSGHCRKYAFENDACVSGASITGCARHLTCIDNKCAPYPASGPCADADEYGQRCAPSSYCDSAATTCQPLKKVGAACAEDTECEDSRCSQGTCVEFCSSI